MRRCILDNDTAFSHYKANMNFSGFSLTHLESLSTKELIDLAGTYGLDIPMDLERVFIIEELLYIESDSAEQAADPEEAPPGEFKELAHLPKQYNISFVEALIRDPLWVFVFWEIKEHDRLVHEENGHFDGYVLRIVPLKGEPVQPDYAAAFSITVGGKDNARYLGFPADGGRCYRVELCALAGENCSVLAVSRPIVLPKLISPRFEKPDLIDGESEIQKVYRNPLAQLSGVDFFPLIQSVDRLSRSRDS